MLFRSRPTLAAALGLLVLTACSESPAPAASPTAPPAPAAAAEPSAPVITDEAGLRAAAATALSEQRIYAPAGDNAIEHYLALRVQRPEDRALATALLELLPYALIGSEQAVARQDFTEARRLLGLIERADPQAPSLARLRESLVAAEAEAARRVLAEAEAEKLRVQQEQRAAEQLAETAERQRLAASAAAAAPAPAPSPAIPAPAAPEAAPSIPTPAPRAATPPPAAATTASARVPRLLSAPSPRYPLMALRRKLEGDVTVAFTIQPDGSVAAPRVLSATQPGLFDEAALVAAKRWRFEPGSAPVASSRVVQFRLAAAQQ